jgi:hypothetical protein
MPSSSDAYSDRAESWPFEERFTRERTDGSNGVKANKDPLNDSPELPPQRSLSESLY